MVMPSPLQKEKILPLPAAGTALGMAFSYYSYPLFLSLKFGHYLILGIILAIIITVSLIRVLKNFSPVKGIVYYKIGIIAMAAGLGFFVGIAARRSVHDTPEFGLPPENVSAVSGILMEDPRTLQGGSGFGIIKLGEAGTATGVRASARGSVRVFFPAESIPRLKEFGRGSEIYIDGILIKNQRGVLFNASSLHVINPASALQQLRTSLRIKLLEKFQNGWGSETSQAPVWGPLASALLLGMRDDLDVDLSQGFRNSGCAHILALSGMHLAILSGVLAFLLKKPLGLRWATLIGAVFVIVYVFIAGSQPSLVRSAIMYLIGAISVWTFLKTKTFSLLCMAFIIQLLFQSETGITLSFILSYLALAGILTLGKSFHSLFRGRLPEILSGVISVSLGAFIVTAPVVAFYFNTLRPIGLIAGLFIAPLSSLFMVLSLIALIAAFLPLPLWPLIDFVMTQVYRLFELLVSFFGLVPGIQISNPWPVLIFTVLFCLLIFYIQRRDYAYRSSIASFD